MYIIHLSFLKRLQNFFAEGYCALGVAKEISGLPPEGEPIRL